MSFVSWLPSTYLFQTFPSLSEPAPVQLLIFPAADFFFIRLPGLLFHSFTGSAASI